MCFNKKKKIEEEKRDLPEEASHIYLEYQTAEHALEVLVGH